MKYILSVFSFLVLAVSVQACAGYAAGFYAPVAPLVVPVVAQSYVYPVAPLVQPVVSPVISPVVSGYSAPVVSGYGSYGVSALVGVHAFRGYRSRFVAVPSRAVVVRSGFRGRNVVNVRVGGRAVVRVRR